VSGWTTSTIRCLTRRWAPAGSGEAVAAVPESRGTASFDEYADGYGDAVQRSIAFSGVEHDLFTRRKARHLLDVVGRLLGPPGDVRALDVGCGVGSTDAYLAGRLGELEGTDVSAEAVRRAEQANPSVRYTTYPGDDLPYEDERFDLAFAICVLHHVPPAERPRFVSELRRVVRPGGLVVVFEHNPLNPLTRLAVARCAFDGDAVLLTSRSARRMLREGGLEPVEQRYVILVPSDRPRVVAAESVLARLPLAAQYYVAAVR
jgi:SAM-dependent methyltransferase